MVRHRRCRPTPALWSGFFFSSDDTHLVRRAGVGGHRNHSKSRLLRRSGGLPAGVRAATTNLTGGHNQSAGRRQSPPSFRRPV